MTIAGSRADSVNPYAPPKAGVELAPAAGLWRSGRLVRMDLGGALPDRCVICNQPADLRRIKRRLYWTSRAWRWGATAALVGCFAIGVAMAPALLDVFWWLLILALVVHLVLRKSLKVELGVCARHRRLRLVLQALSLACIVLLIGSFFIVRESFNAAIALMMGSAVALLVLAIVQSAMGLQAVRLYELAEDHAWLSGTGEPFRASLPELN